jgi:phage terminase large subunit-like protein
MAMDLQQWRAAEKKIDAEQIRDGRPLLDRLSADFLESLEPLEALALAHSPEAYLRPRQITPVDLDWLVTVFLAGRGFGKSIAASGWIILNVLEGTPDKPADGALVAPTIDDCWSLQWRVIKQLLPPWIRYTERISRQSILFPDHGVELFLHSAEDSQYRGPNLRFAWCEEPVKWPRGEELWKNLRLALRVPGVVPPRAVFTTTPPREINWLLELCAQPTTRVIRGAMRDNPMLDERSVDASYAAMHGTAEGARELDGRVVLGVDNALFTLDDLDRFRVAAAPALERIVVAVDPAQSAKADADPVGIVAVGIAGGHLYVLRSCSERLEPVDWACRAIDWAEQSHAGRFVVEPTGSGGYPRATLDAQMRIIGGMRRPIVDSYARGSKADRAAPLSTACAQGRLHLVGRHEALESELTTWFPGARFSPGGLDALVHGASYLTNNWKDI